MDGGWSLFADTAEDFCATGGQLSQPYIWSLMGLGCASSTRYRSLHAGGNDGVRCRKQDWGSSESTQCLRRASLTEMCASGHRKWCQNTQGASGGEFSSSGQNFALRGYIDVPLPQDKGLRMPVSEPIIAGWMTSPKMIPPENSAAILPKWSPKAR